ncbi:phosphate ABC transporter membrane protein 1, phot family [Halosimplex carlsbadense 2-9-1]|uniref:Phosphate transport system permease protein n=1 Tax=Halosimplex carlsbadense 2-9-1 TaxID=797114 RepID=M0CLC4_9EURY|nr:phosphate ABC transporter permease subunit PstC [Halosimplex carlsbadense]ELZ23172.1 phosphate ABC transporter membrane protein 1, phot family [Halosimplex carlsbadense 2-9-1]
MSVATRLGGLDRSAQLVGGVGTVLLALTIGSFLVAPALTGYLALVFGVFVFLSYVVDEENTARFLLFVTTTSTVLILAFITVYLLINAVPVVREMGLYLLVGSDPFWNTGTNVYSLVPAMWGTFLTTIIATLVAAPLGIAGAVFISEVAPGWAREIVKPAVEMLAGIPSIVYGFIGFTVLSPYFQGELAVPQLGNLFIVGFVIGVMALPTVVSVAEDAIAAVPGPMKDGAHALGATDWQTTTSVTLPTAFSGISAAVLLGVGRAVGETMAATVVLANVTNLPEPLANVFGSTITLTSLIASQYGAASGLQFSALFAAGVVLFVTVMGFSVGSQLIERRMRERLGGDQ